jgi:hypothetical protein
LVGGMSGKVESLIEVQKEFKLIGSKLKLKIPKTHFAFCSFLILIRKLIMWVFPMKTVHLIGNLYRYCTGRNKKWE